MEYCFLVKRICFASLSRVCILSIQFQYIRSTLVLYTGAFDFDRGLPRFNYSNWSSFVLVIAIRSEYIRICLFAYVICDDYRARARRLYKRARQGLWLVLRVCYICLVRRDRGTPSQELENHRLWLVIVLR